MKSKILLMMCIMVFAVVLTVDQAPADGDAPTRAATVAEKAFYGNVLKTIEAALPAPPLKWNAVTKPSIEPPKSVYENGSYTLRYAGSWIDPSQQPNRAAEMKLPGQNSAAMEEAMQQMEKASQSGDMKALQAAQEKMMAALGNSPKAMGAQKQPSNQTAVNNACLQVEVSINKTALGLAKPAPLNVKGVNNAVLIDDGDKNPDCPCGEGVVLLGRWGNPDRQREYTYFRTTMRQEIPFPKVENMIVKVRASSARLNEFLNSVKWDKLNALLVK